jgi:hypothetical protein
MYTFPFSVTAGDSYRPIGDDAPGAQVIVWANAPDEHSARKTTGRKLRRTFEGIFNPVFQKNRTIGNGHCTA